MYMQTNHNIQYSKSNTMRYTGISNFRTFMENENRFEQSGSSGLKLQCMAKGMKQCLVWVSRRYEKPRVSHLGIPLYAIFEEYN